MISDGKNTLLKIGDNIDVVTCFQQCYNVYKDQPKEHAQKIAPTGDIDSKCQSIFGYLCNHVYYKLDPDDKQFIKTPARLLTDGYGDCKSLTMYIASCLHCLHIPCIVRFVNFDGGDQYTHVYPVAIDEAGREIVMDMCETNEAGIPYYGYARQFKVKKDIYYGK